MTTSRRLLLLLVLAALALVPFACTTGKSTLRSGLQADVVAKFPPDVQQAYDVFALRCSRCHTLARPLSAQIDDFEHWRHYVARMRKMAGSGISPADADKILVFLKYYSEHRKEVPAVAAEDEGTSTSTRGGP